MTVDIKREMARKETTKYIDSLLKEVSRYDTNPFGLQVINTTLRGFMHQLDDAHFRGDSPELVSKAIEMLAVDMIAQFIMKTVPPTNPGIVYSVVQGMINNIADILGQTMDSYLQPPPATTPPAANVN